MLTRHPRTKLAISSRAGAFAAVTLAAVFATSTSHAGVVPARDARIVEATVFPDRAEVVREAKVNLPSGASTIEFAGVPDSAEPDSFRVTASGVAATLGTVEIRAAGGEPEETPELIAARADVDRIRKDLDLVGMNLTANKNLKEFLDALRAATAARESEKLGQGHADPASIQAVFDLVRKDLGDLAKSNVDYRAQRDKLTEDLKVAQAKLAAAKPAGPIRTVTASVDVETHAAGALTVRLEYLVPQASWRPSYRASLDAATGKIDISSEAVVRQNTGEDWKSVELKLSTAAPARGVKPPELPPLLLRPVEPRALGSAGGVQMKKAPAAEGAFSNIAYRAGAAPAAAQEAERSQAEMVHTGYNLTFVAPGRADLPSDGADHRVSLRQSTLDGKISYRAVPALNAAAYLVARAKSPGAYPLLAGPVRVFAGSAYLGSFPLQETGPGSDLTLPFGVDNRITVERSPLPRKQGTSGIFGRERRLAYGFRTVIENLRDLKVGLVLEDRVPVSEDERIKVEIGAGTTAGYKEVEGRPGILEWSLDLAPHEKREVLLEYTVRFPKDLQVPGAD